MELAKKKNWILIFGTIKYKILFFSNGSRMGSKQISTLLLILIFEEIKRKIYSSRTDICILGSKQISTLFLILIFEKIKIYSSPQEYIFCYKWNWKKKIGF